MEEKNIYAISKEDAIKQFKSISKGTPISAKLISKPKSKKYSGLWKVYYTYKKR